jgi:hypothetical protein
VYHNSFLTCLSNSFGVFSGSALTLAQQQHSSHSSTLADPQFLLACGCLGAQPAQVEASFSTLLDDEDEFELEFEGDEAELVEDDVDETLLVDNLGLSDEVRTHAATGSCFAAVTRLSHVLLVFGAVMAGVSLNDLCSCAVDSSCCCWWWLQFDVPQVVRALKRRGIESLFPIQNLVLRPAMEGIDLTARAKTGSGKTLAFALPVVEALLAEDTDRKTRKAPGRTPRCVHAQTAGGQGHVQLSSEHTSDCDLLSSTHKRHTQCQAAGLHGAGHTVC